MIIKRNNPGNIRKAASFTWQGELPGISAGDLVTFDTLQNGYRAQLKLLNTYVKNGHNTLTKIIERYAPASDNNPTAQYIGAGGVNFVESGTSINRDTVIHADDYDTLSKIAYQMSLFEHGVSNDDGTLQAALNKAKQLLTGIVDIAKNNPGTVMTAAFAVLIIYLLWD